MSFTTSYKSPGMEELLTYLPMSVGAKKIVELGTQQGHSAILLAKSGAHVDTYDSYDEKYSNYPFKDTHADIDKALKNTAKYDIHVFKGDVQLLKPKICDVLHIDICNHEDNIKSIVFNWANKVKKMIILEGGALNKWQKKYGFNPYYPYNYTDWTSVIIEGKKGYAMTVMTRI